MGAIDIDDVSKMYGEVVAVRDLNLDVKDGEFVTLVGPSGCGKSTTIEMMAGLTKPSEGRVSISKEDVTDLPPKDRGISMVFQNIALFPHMDVYDNISYGLQVRGVDKNLIDERVERAAEIVQLEGMMDRMPTEMSGGQQQRVGIARAIVREPEAFLMDEPLANLDAKLRSHMQTELQRIHNMLETTIVYVTHDQEEAMTMSDRIAVLNDGELQQLAPPLECYNEPANRFVAGFIGSPSMNFVEAELDGDLIRAGALTIDMPQSVREQIDTDSVTIGIRPEDIYQVGTAGSETIDPTAEIECRVDVIEPLGDEEYVHLLTDELAGPNAESSQELMLKTKPEVGISQGQLLPVIFDKDNLHLFDGETGETIVHDVTGR